MRGTVPSTLLLVAFILVIVPHCTAILCYQCSAIMPDVDECESSRLQTVTCSSANSGGSHNHNRHDEDTDDNDNSGGSHNHNTDDNDNRYEKNRYDGNRYEDNNNNNKYEPRDWYNEHKNRYKTKWPSYENKYDNHPENVPKDDIDAVLTETWDKREESEELNDYKKRLKEATAKKTSQLDTRFLDKSEREFKDYQQARKEQQERFRKQDDEYQRDKKNREETFRKKWQAIEDKDAQSKRVKDKKDKEREDMVRRHVGEVNRREEEWKKTKKEEYRKLAERRNKLEEPLYRGSERTYGDSLMRGQPVDDQWCGSYDSVGDGYRRGCGVHLDDVTFARGCHKMAGDHEGVTYCRCDEELCGVGGRQGPSVMTWIMGVGTLGTTMMW